MRLLFIRFSSFGDTILTTGVMKYIHENLPNAQIDILTFNEFSAVWRELPFINNIHTVNKGVSLIRYISEIRNLPAYDYIFDLHGNTRSFIARNIVCGKAFQYHKSGISRRLYVKYRFCKNVLTQHVVMRYAKGVLPVLGLKIPNLETLRPYLPNSKQSKKNKIVIHPFASKQTKVWTNFPELAKQLVVNGYDVTIIGKGDFPDIAEVARISTPTLQELFDFIADSELVITTDSGPMHVAIAQNIKLLAIFGSTTRQFGFYPEFNLCTVVERNDVECRPCHIHGQKKCPKGHFNCMNKISVDDVLNVVNQVILR